MNCDENINNQRAQVWDYETAIYLHPGKSFRFKATPPNQEEKWFNVECIPNGCIIFPLILPIIEEE